MSIASDHPASRSAVAGIPTFEDLNIQQATGEECVVLRCRLVSVDGEPVPESVVVGISKATGEPVRACAAHARLVGWRPDSLWEQSVLL